MLIGEVLIQLHMIPLHKKREERICKGFEIEPWRYLLEMFTNVYWPQLTGITMQNLV